MDVLAIEQREGVRLTWFVHNAVLRLPMCSSSHALLPRAAAAVSPTLHTVPRNVWPSSRIEATRMVVPFGALITPLRCVADVRCSRPLQGV
jgi:hypothetical protein